MSFMVKRVPKHLSQFSYKTSSSEVLLRTTRQGFQRLAGIEAFNKNI